MATKRFSLLEDENTDTPTQQENNFAKKVSGIRGVRSGAYRKTGGGEGGSGNNFDVSNKKFDFECKQTAKKSMSIKVDWLEKITKCALPRGRRPALHIQFEKSDPICSKKWVLIEEEVFLDVFGE